MAFNGRHKATPFDLSRPLVVFVIYQIHKNRALFVDIFLEYYQTAVLREQKRNTAGNVPIFLKYSYEVNNIVIITQHFDIINFKISFQ